MHKYIICLLLVLFPSLANAHGGGLDAYGCHYNRKQGGYYCHRGPLAGMSFGSQAEMLRLLNIRQGQAQRSSTQNYQPRQQMNPGELVVYRYWFSALSNIKNNIDIMTGTQSAWFTITIIGNSGNTVYLEFNVMQRMRNADIKTSDMFKSIETQSMYSIDGMQYIQCKTIISFLSQGDRQFYNYKITLDNVPQFINGLKRGKQITFALNNGASKEYLYETFSLIGFTRVYNESTNIYLRRAANQRKHEYILTSCGKSEITFHIISSSQAGSLAVNVKHFLIVLVHAMYLEKILCTIQSDATYYTHAPPPCF